MGIGRVVIAAGEAGYVGMIGLAPIRIRKGAQTIRANIAMNVLVHPEHRSANLFVKMIRAAQAELSSTDEWLIGHPNANAYPGWRRRKMAFRPGMRVHLALPMVGSPSGQCVAVEKGDEDLLDRVDFSRLRAWREQLDQPVIDVDADFLPAQWLVRVGDVRATMTMGQPFPDVWLPRGLDVSAALTLAVGAFDLRYTLAYHDYKLPEVASKVAVPEGR